MLTLFPASRDRQMIWHRASIAVIAFVTWLPHVHAQTPPSAERVALIIGNAAYKDAPLVNTRSDATEMAELLKAAGFTVDLRIDASQESFRSAVTRFGEQVKNPKVKFGMFYYAGHGLQLNSRNYLIPVNANLKTADDVPRQGVDVTDLLRYMEQVNDKSLIVILDACRDDPFSSTYRTGSKGLSPYNAPAGTLLAYATGPGQVALDGTGKNGLYTKHLLRELAVPGESLLDGFMRVRIGVMTESRGRQVPWELSSLIDRDLYLFPGERKKSPELADRVRQDDQESTAWRQMKSGSTLEANEIARFLRIYPNGITAEQAQHLLRRLWAQEQRKDAAADVQVLAKASENPRRDDAAAASRTDDAQAAAALKAEAARMEAERQGAARREAAAQTAEKSQRQRLAEQRALEEQLLAQAVAARAAEQRAMEVQLQAERARREEAVRLAAAEAQAASVELARVNAQMQRAEAARVAATVKSTVAAASVPELEPIRVAPTAYFQGFDEHVRNYRAGDEFEFRIVDNLTRLTTGHRKMRVTAVNADRDRVEYNNGEFLSDLMGNTVRNQLGEFDAVRQFYPANLFVGKQWRTHFKQSRPSGIVYTFRYDLKVVGKERVTVPAGTFDTYKIEARGFNMELNATLQRNIWVAPGINADIVLETVVRLRNGTIEQHDRQELVRYAAPVAALRQ